MISNQPIVPKNDKSLGDLLKVVSEEQRLKPDLIRKRVESAWSEIMGDWISRETDQMSIRSGVLYIRINSAALRQELHFSNEQIRDRLNEFLGETYIKEVVIR